MQYLGKAQCDPSVAVESAHIEGSVAHFMNSRVEEPCAGRLRPRKSACWRTSACFVSHQPFPRFVKCKTRLLASAFLRGGAPWPVGSCTTSFILHQFLTNGSTFGGRHSAHGGLHSLCPVAIPPVRTTQVNTPKEYRSALAPYSLPSSTSGATYCGQPQRYRVSRRDAIH